MPKPVVFILVFLLFLIILTERIMQIQNANSDVILPNTLGNFITAYGSKVKVSLSCKGPGRTKQAHKDECDINKILDRYRKTGVLDFAAKHEPQYGDVTAVDFQEAQFTVAKAMGMFADLPAHVRNRFSNKPGEFLRFVQNPDNRAEAQELGLLKVKEPVAAPVAPVPAPTPTPAPEAPKAA